MDFACPVPRPPGLGLAYSRHSLVFVWIERAVERVRKEQWKGMGVWDPVVDTRAWRADKFYLTSTHEALQAGGGLKPLKAEGSPQSGTRQWWQEQSHPVTCPREGSADTDEAA